MSPWYHSVTMYPQETFNKYIPSHTGFHLALLQMLSYEVIKNQWLVISVTLRKEPSLVVK